MDYKKASIALRPLADNYELPVVAEALETAVKALEELPRLQAEREQLMEDLKGECNVCSFNDAASIGSCDLECWDCQRHCPCRDCNGGSKWEWRGVPEVAHG